MHPESFFIEFIQQNIDFFLQERAKLKMDKINAESLEDVESAILHLSLEDYSPKVYTYIPT